MKNIKRQTKGITNGKLIASWLESPKGWGEGMGAYPKTLVQRFWPSRILVVF